MSDCILYGLSNRETKEKYIGVHKGDVDLDNYMTSSTNRFLTEAIHQDKIDRVILSRGTKEEMYNQEYYFLSLFDAKNNKLFYNKTNGGGPGVKKTYRPSQALIAEVETWVNTGEWKIDSAARDLTVKNLIPLWEKLQESIAAWKTGGTKEYPVEEVSVHTLYITDHNQARAFDLDQEKLKTLTKAFQNPGFARKNITPVIVMVRDGKIVMLLDGNHRVNAASVADWDTFPVIKVDASLFNDDTFTINLFGNLMNHVEAERKGNSIDDLIMRLRELHTKWHKFPINSDSFKEIAKDSLGGKNTRKGGMWSNNDVVRKCDDLAKLDAEKMARMKSTKNFKDYTKAQIIRYWHMSALYNDHPIIVQTLEGVNNGGIGGVIGYAVQNFIANGTNEANLIIHFKSLSSMLNEKDEVLAKLKTTLTHGVKSKINIFFADPYGDNIITEDGLPK